jgi:hypothetical protein
MTMSAVVMRRGALELIEACREDIRLRPRAV